MESHDGLHSDDGRFHLDATGVTSTPRLPPIIQGGMGVAVSNWRLARAVAQLGQIGVVSGTGIDTVLVRRLQDGDTDGVVRRAMAAFPFQDVVREALRRYFLPDGRPPGASYARVPMASVGGNSVQQGMTILGGFVEVFLAKEGHDGKVGVNLLTKLQLPNLAALYGSMLAGVDYVLMGAGIPRDIPGALDNLSQHLKASLKLDVTELPGNSGGVTTDLVPSDFGADALGPLKRPDFLPIVSSHSLAGVLQKKANGSVEGFIVEGPTAGGHNAPPRGPKVFDDQGQPVYGERDVADLEAMCALGLPFWLAGSYGSPEGLSAALAAGAAGVQVGTLFAYCEESGLEEAIKEQVVGQVRAGATSVRTDARASPTGFPFKVVALPGTASEAEVYAERKRVCDLGYLREVYRKEEGGFGYRCAAEPVADYVAKGGDVAETEGRKCLCNALMVNIGLGQIQKGGRHEPALLTSGDDLPGIARLLPRGGGSYRAADVIDYLLGRTRA
jgi:NAD(P)H-dependent flavin oxidoreductase YrpB (nitropropane dioxygenase family)